jgi:hypothetical protein
MVESTSSVVDNNIVEGSLLGSAQVDNQTTGLVILNIIRIGEQGKT